MLETYIHTCPLTFHILWTPPKKLSSFESVNKIVWLAHSVLWNIYSSIHEKDSDKNSSHSDIQLWLLFEHYEPTAHCYPTYKLRAHLSSWRCTKNKVHGQQCYSITISPDNKQGIVCACVKQGFPNCHQQKLFLSLTTAPKIHVEDWM
jgi:hypothetical protein